MAKWSQNNKNPADACSAGFLLFFHKSRSQACLLSKATLAVRRETLREAVFR
jgi:hypothetical protein